MQGRIEYKEKIYMTDIAPSQLQLAILYMGIASLLRLTRVLNLY